MRISILILTLIGTLTFSCSKNDAKIEPLKNTREANIEPAIEDSSKANLAIGIKNDADLSLVFNTLNELNFKILDMSGFSFNSNTPPGGVIDLIDLLNQKPYINTGVWKATPYSVYFYEPENKTRIINTFFNMDVENQTDLINLIASLGLEDRLGETKNIVLRVPTGTHTYWKTQMMTYPFVRWTETFDQVCIHHAHAYVNSANVPAQGFVNQTIPIAVTFSVNNGCGDFGSITETNLGKTKTLTVNAKYEGCICTLAIETVQTVYNFIPKTKGTHTIIFSQPGGDPLKYTINIK